MQPISWGAANQQSFWALSANQWLVGMSFEQYMSDVIMAYVQSRLRNLFQISCWCQKCVQLPNADTASVHSCKGFILPECFLGGKNYPSWTAACNVLLIDTSSNVLPSEKELALAKRPINVIVFARMDAIMKPHLAVSNYVRYPPGCWLRSDLFHRLVVEMRLRTWIGELNGKPVNGVGWQPKITAGTARSPFLCQQFDLACFFVFLLWLLYTVRGHWMHSAWLENYKVWPKW